MRPTTALLVTLLCLGAAGFAQQTKSSTESAFQRADKAREDYVVALDAYEKPLAAIRTIALTHGTAL